PRDDAEGEAGIDEEIRLALAGLDPPVMRERHRLERPRRRRADGDDAALAVEGAGDGRRRRGADAVVLRLEAVILDPLDADRLKGAIADVEGNRGGLDAACGECGDERGGEVEAGGGRG